ncbi:MAG: CinA family protein [Sphingomonadaceae bacterium]|nr:CinA family protein [Sphingomonadaceae bacterium]
MTFDPAVLALAEQVVAANRAAGRTIVTAESCTGGLVAGALTEVAGASEVVDRGFVTYSNEAKMEALGVHGDLIDTFGAVSVAVAWAMAQGALKHSHADVAVAITGIAGPGGGSPKKPVGTVVFAVAERGQEAKIADTRAFGDLGRTEIRRQAVLCALELLLPKAPAG